MRRLALLFAACSGKSPPAPTVVASTVVVADAAVAVITQCAAPTLPEPPPGVRGAWTVAGRVLSGPDARIGVIADTAGASAETLAAVGRLRAKLDVELVIALGGIGSTQAELEAVFTALGTTAPVIALPGDLESLPAQAAAVAHSTNVLDGRLLRRVDLASASIALVGGASAAERLLVDGCTFTPGEVAAALADLTPRTGLRILATAEAPRHTVDGDASGERSLVPGAGQQLDLMLHGAADLPSPAAKGGRDGEATPLTPGSADAASRLGPARVPSAGILAIKAGTWTWTPVRDGK